MCTVRTSDPSMYVEVSRYRLQYLFVRSQTPTAGPHGWRAASRARAAEGLERASPSARRQR